MNSTKTALISGAGVAGLTAAWHLAQLGWKVVVVEKAIELRSGGYMMSLSGPGYKAAEKMGILDELSETHVYSGKSVFRNKDGKKLWQISYSKALKDLEWITLSRTRLVKVLYKKTAAQADIRFGTYPTKVVSTQDDAHITLNDGSIIQADLFIGADGLRSSARRLIFGESNDYMHPTGYRCAVFQFPNHLHLGEEAVNYGEPGRTSEFYSIGKDRLASLYLWKESDQNPAVDNQIPQVQIRQRLLDAYEGANANVIKAIEDLPANEDIYCDTVQMIKMPTWHIGCCLLLGDAAHCLTLASGQGAGMAMTSAAMLADALKQHRNITDALEHHDRKLRPIINAIQEKTKKIIKGYVPTSTFGFWLRNFLLRCMPERWIGFYVANSVRKESASAEKALDEMLP